VHRHSEDPERLVQSLVARPVNEQLPSRGISQLLMSQQPDFGVRRGSHHPAAWRDDLRDGFIWLKLFSSRRGQVRYRLPHQQSAELGSAGTKIALDVTIYVTAQLKMQESTDRGKHYGQSERESERKPPANGQPVHAFSSVRSR